MKRRKPAPSAAALPFSKPLRKERMDWAALKREAAILNRGQMRHDVIVRAAGRCEWCRVPVPPGELHHVLSGSQRRRKEDVSTLAFVCLACHAAAHRNDEDTLRFALAWANALGFEEARIAIMRRIEKAIEAKWSHLKGAA